jgi:hypothetical protein
MDVVHRAEGLQEETKNSFQHRPERERKFESQGQVNQ